MDDSVRRAGQKKHLHPGENIRLGKKLGNIGNVRPRLRYFFFSLDPSTLKPNFGKASIRRARAGSSQSRKSHSRPAFRKILGALGVSSEMKSKAPPTPMATLTPVSYTHLRAHETVLDLVC